MNADDILAVSGWVAKARTIAIHQHRDEELRSAVIPTLAQFKKDGILAPLVSAVEGVVGPLEHGHLPTHIPSNKE